MALNLIETYIPNVDELDPDAVRDASERAAAILLKKFPDLDFTPGSVLGDMVKLPFGNILAIMETALDRFMSDLNLGNVAGGTVWNCAFVREFLKNFAVYEQESLQASGVIRLTFTADADVTLDRGLRFSFGGTDNIFSMRLPFVGPMEIRKVGMPLAPATNTRNLSEIAPGLWAVDVSVVGTMAGNAVLESDTAALDRTVTGLSTAIAVSDFETGSPPDSIPELARKTRETFYSASFNQRNSGVRFLMKEFPDLVGASIVITGDNEMVRDSFNVLGIGNGSADVYVKSKAWGRAEEHTIRLTYYEEQSAVSVRKFIGKLNLVAPPVHIDSITYEGDDTLDLHAGGTGWRIMSKSLNPVRCPVASAGFSSQEELWLIIDMPVDPDTSDDLIVPDTASDGSQYATFKISYRSDPIRQSVEDVVTASDTAPIGVDVLVKGYPVMVISRLVVSYTRKRGVSMSLDGARAELHDYFRTLGHPNVFSESRIHDIMFYAGAEDVTAITCDARLKWSLAGFFLPEDTATPDEDYAEAFDEALVPRQISTSSPRGLLPEYRDVNAGTANETFEAVGLRNITCLLDSADIVFQEVVR